MVCYCVSRLETGSTDMIGSQTATSVVACVCVCVCVHVKTMRALRWNDRVAIVSITTVRNSLQISYRALQS